MDRNETAQTFVWMDQGKLKVKLCSATFTKYLFNYIKKKNKKK